MTVLSCGFSGRIMVCCLQVFIGATMWTGHCHCSHFPPFRGRDDGAAQRGFLGGRLCRGKGLEAGGQAKSGKGRCWLRVRERRGSRNWLLGADTK